MKIIEQKILDILEDKEMHGYELVETLNRDPHVSFEQRIGIVYPILRLLKKQRFLKTYEITVDGKNRIYYTRTRRRRGDMNES